MSRDRPITLYKYKDLSGNGIDHVEDILRNNQIWYSSPLDFNDPFDCRCVVDIDNSREDIVLHKAAFLAKRNGVTLAGALAEADNEIPLEPKELEDWQKRKIEGLRQSVENSAILCLIPAYDDFSMWTHYAKNHTGICIQFRVRHVSEQDQSIFIAAAQPVEYADRCPVINPIRDGIPDIASKVFWTKATPFRHEQEWRSVLLGQGRGLKPIPKGIVGAVFLGCKVDSEDRERVINACSEYDGDVDIVQATLDPEIYGLAMIREKTV